MKNNNQTLMILSVIVLLLVGIGFRIAGSVFGLAVFTLVASCLSLVWIYYQKKGESKNKIKKDNYALTILLVIFILMVVVGAIIVLSTGMMGGYYGNGFGGGMMEGYYGNGFGQGVFTIIMFIALVSFIIWIFNQINGGNKNGKEKQRR